jgi:pentatricopeptide repeat protein
MQQLDRVSPNRVTFICGLKACTSIGAIDKGIGIHAQIEKKGLERDTAIGNTLVNMYARCGSPGQAREIFDKLLVKDTVAWTSLIGGYAQIGESQNVFDSFESMVSKGIAPNAVTFVTVLSACRHAVSFETGKSYFDTMKEWYGISPDRVHYTCLIDLYGRTGELESVLAMMKKLPFCPSLAMWQALMHSCRKWGNEELGKQSFQTAMKGMVVGSQYAGATHRRKTS